MCTLYQYSHAYVFEQGRYDGKGLIEDLKQHGNIGLGTFNAMNGELVIADDAYYQCTEGKHIDSCSAETKLPWAAITRFTENVEESALENIASMQDFVTRLLEKTDAENHPFVIQVRGHFNQVTFRHVLKQEKPYRDIQTVFGESPEQHPKNVEANLVGFYIPERMYPLQAPGIHLHGITADKQHGGHVLDFDLSEASLQLEQITHVKMDLRL